MKKQYRLKAQCEHLKSLRRIEQNMDHPLYINCDRWTLCMHSGSIAFNNKKELQDHIKRTKKNIINQLGLYAVN